MDWKILREKVMPRGARRRDNPFRNRFYGYRQTDLELPDGRKATYHGVLIPECVHIVALEDDLTTYLVRQSRPNARQAGSLVIPKTLELPGGFAKEGLTLEAAAQNELAGEIKRYAGTMEKVGVILPSAGISNERDHIFMGTKLTPVVSAEEVEATEQDMRIVSGPFGKLYDSLLQSRSPVSAQTLAAMGMVARRL